MKTFLTAVLGKLWPVIGRPTQVSKKEIFYLFPFGLACYLWGTLFINRQNKKSAQNAINRESKAINERKVKKVNQKVCVGKLKVFLLQSKILFFPEGTRNHSGEFNFLMSF